LGKKAYPNWIVTDRFAAPMLPDARVAMGPFSTFPTKESAIMAAIMMAGNGSNRSEFGHLLEARWQKPWPLTSINEHSRCYRNIIQLRDVWRGFTTQT
jgi:hypothetical protein